MTRCNIVTRVTKAKLRSKGQRSRSIWKWIHKNRFSRLSSSKLDRLKSNQDQHYHQTILHISRNTFQWRKFFVLW